ncbi:hypothetical protein FNV43_RR02105 [Rhamnella rubrinervis]|uniref:Leucine-rich repeat-containing N-terminal plant-type domain-containing protein n=1 Tax=Rhamnella rubrinervis TaxID=2594499 RepID=A0A8K0MSY3_9ROSA|nr:hypothetical protein FNV43_RR02105 [Rhamnella rubrinervis]
MKSTSYENSYSLMFYFILLVSCFCSYASCSKYPNVSTTASTSSLVIISCLPDQSNALLQFKGEFASIKPDFTSYYYYYPYYINPFYDADVHESYPKMTSWKKEKDCCSWDGVTCNNKTGKVVALDLSNSWLQGPLRSNSSLFKLNALQEINLSYNNFSFSIIPSEFVHLPRLTHLNLSYSMFSGHIPSEISFLSHLVSLSLSSFLNYDATNLLHLRKLDFTNLIQNMTNLRHFCLHHVNISSSIPKSLANLSSLTTLSLGGCSLHGKFPEKVFQLSKLEVIRVPFNYLLTGILPEFEPSNSLRVVNLDFTKFSGKLPNSIGNLNSLSRLALYECNFLKPLPSSFWNLSQLTHLDLSSNYFSGHVLPSALGNLVKLKVLLLHSSQFSGEVPSSIENLTQLQILLLNNNSFSGQIQNLLGNLTKLETLSISSNNFSGQIPASLGNLNELKVLDLTDNNLDGVIPSSLFTMPSLNTLLLASNQFTGPLIIQNISSSQLEILDLGENKLNGRIPRWLGSSIEILNLQGNNFNESIPHEIFTNGSMHNRMRVVDLSQNQFQGRVPQSLINCSKLQVLNLGHNQISDTFPFWLQSLPKLQVLILRSNKFFGPIWHPNKYFGFINLGTLDLSFNNFNGSLPSEYFKNWGYMSKGPDGNKLDVTYFSKHKQLPDHSYIYKYSVSVMNKGSEMELWKALNIFMSIDLSNNKLDGEIPSSIGNLESLITLNLSSNNFTGTIPLSFGNMSELESLDLSKNKLSGRIPQQLADLTFLGYLNVSHNQLTGPIPQGTQLDTFSYSSFEGNPGLCGSQLSKKCKNTDTPIPFLSKDEEESENSFTWKVVAMGYACGFVVVVVIVHVILSRRSSWFWRSFVGRYFYGLW